MDYFKGALITFVSVVITITIIQVASGSPVPWGAMILFSLVASAVRTVIEFLSELI